jgi:putative restriction endonuclease
MRLFVGVTDRSWYEHLRRIPDLDEVNFWQPSGNRLFQALPAGGPFLFKLHSPDNYIVGGGFFQHATLAPVSLAWKSFGEKNGASTYAEMRQRVEKYRRIAPAPHEDYRLGCILLVSPFFFEPHRWIPVPESWARNIVQGRGYTTDDAEGQQLWDEVQLRIAKPADEVAQVPQLPLPMFGEPVPTRHRLGQGTFRILVTDLYHRRCAISGEKALPALEAAHIRPVAEGGQHEPSNGLLFRSDIHRLYDRGYVTVAPDYRFQVSRRLKDDFDNGEPYYPLAGREIERPADRRLWPRREWLEWHADSVFLSG